VAAGRHRPGGSRFLLAAFRSGGRALVAVTGQEVENISIAVAAHGMTEDLHTVLHAGRGEVAAPSPPLRSP
jgi:hypothetical protein